MNKTLMTIIVGAIIASAPLILGWIAWWLKIYRITNDPNRTFFVVSKIPKMIIIAEGIRFFLGYPLLMSFAAAGLSVLQYSLMEVAFDNFSAARASFFWYMVVVVVIPTILAFALWLGFAVYIGKPQIQSLLGPAASLSWRTGLGKISTVASIVAGVVAAQVLGGGVLSEEQTGEFFVFTWTAFLQALIVLLIVSFALSLLAAVAYKPVFSRATIERENGNIVEGKLLAESNGTYLLIDEGDNLLPVATGDTDKVQIH